MNTTEVNALITELQQQLVVLSSRAAQYAAMVAVVTSELDLLKQEQETQKD